MKFLDDVYDWFDTRCCPECYRYRRMSYRLRHFILTRPDIVFGYKWIEQCGHMTVLIIKDTTLKWEDMHFLTVDELAKDMLEKSSEILQKSMDISLLQIIKSETDLHIWISKRLRRFLTARADIYKWARQSGNWAVLVVKNSEAYKIT